MIGLLKDVILCDTYKKGVWGGHFFLDTSMQFVYRAASKAVDSYTHPNQFLSLSYSIDRRFSEMEEMLCHPGS